MFLPFDDCGRLMQDFCFFFFFSSFFHSSLLCFTDETETQACGEWSSKAEGGCQVQQKERFGPLGRVFFFFFFVIFF
jgi:hypothetical protein